MYDILIKNGEVLETTHKADIVVFDKTGTLTQNKMTVTEINFGGEKIKVDHLVVNDDENLKRFLDNITLSNDVKTNGSTGGYLGDPTEIALVEMTNKFGRNKDIYDTRYERVAEVPFDSERKMMTTVNKIDGELIVHTKGALESLIHRCSKAMINGKLVDMTDKLKEEILDTNSEMARADSRQ